MGLTPTSGVKGRFGRSPACLAPAISRGSSVTLESTTGSGIWNTGPMNRSLKLQKALSEVGGRHIFRLGRWISHYKKSAVNRSLDAAYVVAQAAVSVFRLGSRFCSRCGGLVCLKWLTSVRCVFFFLLPSTAIKPNVAGRVIMLMIRLTGCVLY